jgi:hypothetical protein
MAQRANHTFVHMAREVDHCSVCLNGVANLFLFTVSKLMNNTPFIRGPYSILDYQFFGVFGDPNGLLPNVLTSFLLSTMCQLLCASFFNNLHLRPQVIRAGLYVTQIFYCCWYGTVPLGGLHPWLTCVGIWKLSSDAGSDLEFSLYSRALHDQAAAIFCRTLPVIAMA